MCLSKVPFSPSEFRPFKLISIKPYNYNVSIFRFELKEKQISNLPVASCLTFRANFKGKEFIRPYTPISKSDTTGYVDFLVKTYKQGNLSKYIFSLNIGDSIDIKGPFKKISHPFNAKSIIMLAGGTGITPMLQVIHKILDSGEDTLLYLIFANAKPEDILLKDTFCEFEKKHDNFKVHFVVEKNIGEKSNEKYSEGYITEEIIRNNTKCCSLKGDTKIFVCGPPPFMKAMSGGKMPDKSQGKLDGLLKKMGYDENDVYKF